MDITLPVKIMKGGLIRIPAQILKKTPLREYYENGKPVMITIHIDEEPKGKENEVTFYGTLKKYHPSENKYRYLITVPLTVAKVMGFDKYVNTEVKVTVKLQ